MNPLHVLHEIKVASPCPAPWQAMSGDDRVRFCDGCSRHVYDLSAMTGAEAVDLVRATEGRLCVRFYRRTDGTLITADCPVGVRAALRRRLGRLVAAAVALFVTVRGGLAFVSTDFSALRQAFASANSGPTWWSGNTVTTGMLCPLPPMTPPGNPPECDQADVDGPL